MTGELKRGLWVEAGDTFFTHSESLLGRLIRWGETDPGETNGTWTNHTGVVVEAGYLVPPDDNGNYKLAVVIEALWKTQRVEWWTAHKAEVAKGQRIRAFRPIPRYNDIELARFAAEAQTFVGDTYGWWKLIGLLVDRSIFRGKKVVSTLFCVKSRPICSFLAALANEAARRRGGTYRTTSGDPAVWPGFGMPAQAADPDEMMDFCLASGVWEEI